MKKHSGKGTLNYSNGDVYKGVFEDDEPQRIGKMTYKDGRVSGGIWKNGKIVYEGQLAANVKAHGRGKRVYSNGSYEGDWNDGLMDGKGTYKWLDGTLYEGDWKNGKIHGKGTQKRFDGSVYEGESGRTAKCTERESKSGLMEVWNMMENGRTVFGMERELATTKTVTLILYTSEWRADKRHGNGVMTYANQDRYDGEWKENRKDGKGTMKYHNGDVYEGEFSKDNMHGQGTFEYAAGDVLKSIGGGRRERGVACLKILRGLANKSTMIMMKSSQTQT